MEGFQASNHKLGLNPRSILIKFLEKTIFSSRNLFANTSL